MYNIDIPRTAKFALFVTSYTPLFFIIILRQFFENSEYLNWAGISLNSIYIFFKKFGLSSILFAISTLGIIGCIIILNNLNKNINNGVNVTIIDIKNKNSESISYIATYIIPFISQGFNQTYEILSFLILMIIIYNIYTNSNLVIINPILSLKYSVYEINYREQNGKERNCFIIIDDKNLDEYSIITINRIKNKLFFAKTRQSKTKNI